MCVHLLNELASLVAAICADTDLLVVAGDLSNAEHTRLLIHHLIDIVCSGDLALTHKVGDDRGVDATASGTHHNALEGSETHRGIEALAVYNCREGCAVAEVAGNYLGVLLAEKLYGSAANEAVRGAVEAVTADLVLLIVLVGNAVHINVIGHSAVEAGIKYRNLRNRHDLLTLYDTLEVRGVVERAKVAALLDDSLYLVGNENRAGKLLTAVKNSVTYSADLINRCDNADLGIYESVKNELKCLAVSGKRALGLVILLAGNLELESGLAADLLANTLCDYLFIFHIDELELERGAACVDNKNFHFFDSLYLFFIISNLMWCQYTEGRSNIKYADTAMAVPRRPPIATCKGECPTSSLSFSVLT